jgi:hypothetical protein
MKIFIGPTGRGLDLSGLTVLPPAQQGDIATEVLKGPDTLILIDGYFTQHLAPWHKEILFAIEKGCRVIGAGSLGALRAVECKRYGMEAVGVIAKWYENYTCLDDSEVALAHSCAEDGYVPLSVPLVNIRATVQALNEDPAIIKTCSDIFYMERSWQKIKSIIGVKADLLKEHYVDQKAIDARAAIQAAKTLGEGKSYEKSDRSIFMTALLATDITGKDGKRLWETATFREEATDSWLLAEFASILGIRASQEQVDACSSRMWANLGIDSEKAAVAWQEKNDVTDETWNSFAFKEAVKQNARNWFNAITSGAEAIQVTNRYQLLKGKSYGKTS